MSTIRTAPSAGLSYSPLDAHYFDPESLRMELERVYDICHGCRLCFNLCPSFPALFEAVDSHDGDVLKISARAGRVPCGKPAPPWPAASDAENLV